MTLKNFGAALLVLVVLLIAANLLSEAGRAHDSGYGRLFDHEMRKTEAVVPRKVEVVHEAPAITDRDTADPLLLAPAAREQYLQPAPAQATVQAAAEVAPPVPLTTQPNADHGRVAIVGDGSGVAVVGNKRVLGGGFGR